MQTIETPKGNKIHSWCPSPEQSAIDQIVHLADLPFVKHSALMPDAHMGQNMPIGGVIACDNALIMDAVGVDVGCGMCAMQTSLSISDLQNPETKKALHHSMTRSIPTGFSHNSDRRIEELRQGYSGEISSLLGRSSDRMSSINPVGDISDAVFSQLGTLGGGNHFLEVQHDENGSIWVMIHSGSRNIGKRIGDHFNALAEKLNRAWRSNSDIPFLPADSGEGKAYFAWMTFALDFAFLNRKVMMDAVKKDLTHMFPGVTFLTDRNFGTQGDLINIHHNFAALENHMGQNLWVHRKGATKADKGSLGIIPGSMGTNSYITRGRGERLSLMSSSHGAGRKMGRKEFCRQMADRYDEIEKALEGVTHSEFGKVEYGKGKGLKDVSEAPQAYKDIDLVISQELDLIEPIVKLKPLISLKG